MLRHSVKYIVSISSMTILLISFSRDTETPYDTDVIVIRIIC